MYLTAFLAQELARIAQLDHETAARQSRRARLVEGDLGGDPPRVSLMNRIALAVRPTHAPCTPSC